MNRLVAGGSGDLLQPASDVLFDAENHMQFADRLLVLRQSTATLPVRLVPGLDSQFAIAVRGHRVSTGGPER